jgi:hypothetical protein
VTIHNDPTSPIFQSTTSGGINIAGKGINYANTKIITPVKNVDKHTGKVETSVVSLLKFLSSSVVISCISEEFSEKTVT